MWLKNFKWVIIAVLLLIPLLILVVSKGNFIKSYIHHKTATKIDDNLVRGSETGLALPRFVSVKVDIANVRVGPGFEYDIAWFFKQKFMPVEIIQEYENWRKVRDFTGGEGWIYKGLLSSYRSVLVSPWPHGSKEKNFQLFASADPKDRVVATVASGALAKVISCDGNWCHLSFSNVTGWMPQKILWGIYPEEKL